MAIKCEPCNLEMELAKNVPHLGRRSLGKRFLKLVCSKCKSVKYMKPSEYRRLQEAEKK